MWAQFNVNSFLNDAFWLEESSKQEHFGIEATALAANNEGTMTYAQLSPKFYVPFNKSVSIYFKHNLVKNNAFYSPLDEAKRFYQYKEFSGINSYTEEGYLHLNYSFLQAKIGRFYDQLGTAPYDNLFIGSQDYHDGYKFTFFYKKLEFSTRFYQLSNYWKLHQYNRYFYQHSLKWNVNKRFSLEFIEMATTASKNGAPKFHYINPLTSYYAIQTNHNINSNTILGFVAQYSDKQTAFWLEFLLDDFQIDETNKQGVKEKEPTEFGLQVGAKYAFQNSFLLSSLSVVRNRTYNDEVELEDNTSFTKYIDHDKTIGHSLGNNFVHGILQYVNSFSNSFKYSAVIEYGVFGDENVFSRFNTDFYNRETNEETIPYGKIRHTLALENRLYYLSSYGRFYASLTYAQEPKQAISFWLGYSTEVTF